MEMTDTDKKYLLEKIYGGIKKTFDGDLPQIEEAADVTKYKLVKYAKDNYTGDCEKKVISRKVAICLLGRETWLSGLVRSAFHWTSTRTLGDGRRCIMFDSSKLFR